MISIADLEKLAADRDSWKSVCASGLNAHCSLASDQAAEERRCHMHNPPTQRQLVL